MSVLAALPTRPLTVDDLDALPDDGHRYELVDGSLIVTAAPIARHQVVATRMFKLLDRLAPADVLPLNGGGGVELRADRVVIPDVLVVRADLELGRHFRPADVVLVVEVVSPSNAVHDLVTKRELYRQHGIGHYWLVDARGEPTVTVLRLVDEQYVETVIGPADEATVELPYPVTIRPADLLS